MEPQKTGNLINRVRNAKQMTQKQLAEKLNISDKAVSKWERGDCCPDVVLIPKLCELFDISVENFMEGKMPEEVKNNLQGKRILTYDFKRPDLFSKCQLNTIWNAFGSASEKLTKIYSGFYTEQCNLHIAAVDQLTNEDFFRSLTYPTFFYDFDFKNMGFAIQMDKNFAKKLLKQDAVKYPDLNEFDFEVLYKYYVESVATEFQSAFYEKTDKSVSKENFIRKLTSTSSNYVNFKEDGNKMCCLVTLECNIGDFKGYINIQFNEKYLRRTMRKLGFFRDGNPQVKNLNNIKRSENFNSFVEFGRFSADEITFEPDDLILLDRQLKDGVMLIYKNTLIANGEVVCCGLNGDYNWGFRVKNKADGNTVFDEKDYIAVRLGCRNLNDDDVAGITEGTILELNEMVGDPVIILKNGKKVARGEIEIVDEKFGVRILE